MDCGAPAQGYDGLLLRRIATALARSLAQTAGASDDVWTGIVANHRHFVEMLSSGQLEAANDLLARMFATSLTYGFDQHGGAYDLLVTEPAHLRFVHQLAFDKLLSLAAYLRVVPLQNIEQGDFTPYLKASPDSLLEGIEAKIGVPIVAPPFHGGLYGIRTDHGLFSERSFSALYVALRVKELMAGIAAPRVCEIGGGTGYVAYYCSMLGVTDYTIVDLPTVSAVQAYFLAKNLPGSSDQIVLAGEVDSTTGGEGSVKLMSGADFEAGPRRFDLVVNVDSFPEMGGTVLRAYLGHIRSYARLLLSVNQEAMAARSAQPGDHQERVGDVIDRLGGFRRLTRFPSWVRPGYVEELYEMCGPVQGDGAALAMISA